MRFIRSLDTCLLAGVLVVVAAGCVSRESGQKAISDPSKVSQIQKGVSTKADIQNLFGDPSGRSFGATGTEIWVYRYHSASVDPKTYIPLVGGLVGGVTGQADALAVTFGNDGFVKSYAISKSGNAS